MSEQPAGPYVNRRGRARSIFLLCLAFLFHNNNNKQLLSLQDTFRQPDVANRGISDVSAEDKRNSRRSPLPSFALLSTPGSLRQRKAAPPTATAPAPNTTYNLHQPTLSLPPPPPTSGTQPCFSVSPRYCCIDSRCTLPPHLDSRALPRLSTASLLTAAPGLVFFLHNNPSFTHHLDPIPAQHGCQPGSRWHSLAWYVLSLPLHLPRLQ